MAPPAPFRCLFKEFGIRLTFTPTIAGDVIRLKVTPEVSTLDFANGITLEGFRIPALTTRRAQTVVELRDGQSFAIAGLLDNESQNDEAAIPMLSKLPIIGHLFKSKADRKEQTELMVLITPRLVRALDPDEVPPLPTSPDTFMKRAGRRRPRVPAASATGSRGAPAWSMRPCRVRRKQRAEQVAVVSRSEARQPCARRPFRSESQRGAVLIHVAIALLGLIAFTTFVVDYGVMWVSRGQAQTSADAGALSGAISLAFDSRPTSTARRRRRERWRSPTWCSVQAPDVDLAAGNSTGRHVSRRARQIRPAFRTPA